MVKSTVKRFTSAVRALGDDERGAESSEVILVLVLLVIGLMAAWAFLRDKISASATKTGNCISNADTATKC